MFKGLNITSLHQDDISQTAYFSNQEEFMKALLLAVLVLPIFTVPLYAQDRCINEAKTVGYLGPQEMLAPCAATPSEASQEIRMEWAENESGTQSAQMQAQPSVQTAQVPEQQ